MIDYPIAGTLVLGATQALQLCPPGLHQQLQSAMFCCHVDICVSIVSTYLQLCRG